MLRRRSQCASLVPAWLFSAPAAWTHFAVIELGGKAMARRHTIYRMDHRAALLLMLLLCIGALSRDGLAADDLAGRAALPETATEQTGDAAKDCRQLAALIDQQKSLIARETGQIKREIAALRDDLSKPGFREILGGIGYIFGLAGIGFYIHSRRSRPAAANRTAR
jgi:hypothetical protein